MAVTFTSDIQLQLEFTADNWTDVAADILQIEEVVLNYGIRSDDPKQRVASGGFMDFVLDNDETNSGGLKGYYTPGSSNVRSGFANGIGARLAVTHGGDTYYKFSGRLTKIKPDTGKYGRLHAKCRAQDWIADASHLKPEGLEVQTTKRGDELLTTAVAAVTNQPPATSYGTGKSTFAYSFDEIRDGQTTLLQVMKNIALSELGFIGQIGDTDTGGVLTFWNRHARVLDTDILIDMDDEGDSDSFYGLKIQDDERLVYNNIRITTFPRVVDTTASDQILWTLGGDDPTISAGETLTIIGRYRDPSQPGVRIAGVDVITPVEGEDFTFSGADSDLGTTDTTLGGNAVTYVVKNNSGASGTVTKLQVRGKRVLVYEPAIVENSDSDSIDDHGDRLLRMRLTYQDDPTEGQDFADIILSRYKDSKVRAQSLSFSANKSASLMAAALQGEPGRKISITEYVSNLSSSEYVINAVEMRIKPTNLIDVTWTLAEAAAEASSRTTRTIAG